MTNETTASQPKSIGDDAQKNWTMINAFSIFQELTGAMDAISKGHQDSAEIARLVLKRTDKIHPLFLAAYEGEKLRAPAAQASATIQAASDANELHFNAQRLRNVAALVGVPADGDDAHVDGVRGALLGLIATKLRLAATIQEPVMVAEPVGKRVTLEELHAVICEDGKVGNYLALSIAEKVMKMLPAAPMVADPAGVAVTYPCWNCKKPYTLDQRSYADGRCPHCDVDIDLELDDEPDAATVKAVSSAALDAFAYFVQPSGFGPFIECSAQQPGSFVAYRAVKIAAPLAEKTGGGE